MRMITGAILLLVAEQAFYHAHSIGFPHYRFVNEILLPTSGLISIVGVGMIVAGLWFDRMPGFDRIAANQQVNRSPDSIDKPNA